MSNINEAKNVIGMGGLMDNSNSSNILELERNIINGAGTLLEEEENDARDFKKEMERLNNQFNLDVSNSYDNDEFSIGNLGSNSNQTSGSNYNSSSQPSSNYNGVGNSNGSNSNGGNMGWDKPTEDTQLNYMTIEQKKQNYVNEVLQDINNDEELEFDIDKERDEDEKNNLLEQIDALRATLDDDGVSTTNVPHVTKDNTISDIKNVHKILILKNNRNRCCSFAEEAILAAAYGLEYLFDGKNEWLGKKPDLVGWNNTVRIKLRRCRFQTSTLVKEMMQDYNMGPGVQLLFELIPSMFLYSKQKNLANTDSIAQDMEYDNANRIISESMG
jgi:hypothetical protein